MDVLTLFQELFANPCKNAEDNQELLQNGTDVSVKAFDNVTLTGEFYPAEEQKRIVLAVHDIGKSVSYNFGNSIPLLHQLNTSVLAVNLRGHATSGGDYCSYGIKEYKDVLSWLNYIKENLNPEKLPIYLAGVGIGGTAVLLAGGQELAANVKGLILTHPEPTPIEALKNAIQEYDATLNAVKLAEEMDQHLMKEYHFSLYDQGYTRAFGSCQRPALFLSDAHNIYYTYPAEKHSSYYGKEDEMKATLQDFFLKYDNQEQLDTIKIHLPKKTMYQAIVDATYRLPNDPAYEFQGKYTTYKEFLAKIDAAAKAFSHHGIHYGDVVTLCMPNLPTSLDIFYGLNKIGAIASMIHPLSAEKEIKHYLNISKSKAIVVPDQFYEKVLNAVNQIGRKIDIIVVRIQDSLPLYLKYPYILKEGKKHLQYPYVNKGITWTDYVKESRKDKEINAVAFNKNKTSVILYSGGTTGLPKGICLTDLNFNALALESINAIGCEFARGDRILAAMPVFHGFGLGIGIHTCIINNVCCLLMPTVSTKSYANYMVKKHPNYIAGVPTIYKMLIGCDELKNQDLSFMKGMFVGGDGIPVPLKYDVDTFLKAHGATIQVREGYGLTECVTASCLTPKGTYKEGSIGVAYPNTVYDIVEPGTTNRLPVGETGEIILTGPTLMLGYLDNPEATADTLVKHEDDGQIWLHTGDQGHMDEDGYVFFHQRMKRMIITSGYNVSPAQVEAAINNCDFVDYSCVIGIPDPYKMQRIKAFVVLKPDMEPSEELKEKILIACKKDIAGYALPREIEFRTDLPKTLVGKVAFHTLEEEEIKKQEAAKAKADSAKKEK